MSQTLRRTDGAPGVTEEQKGEEEKGGEEEFKSGSIRCKRWRKKRRRRDVAQMLRARGWRVRERANVQGFPRESYEHPSAEGTGHAPLQSDSRAVAAAAAAAMGARASARTRGRFHVLP